MTERLSILCFGDSLTAGFYRHGLGCHPYAKKLHECLQAAFPTAEFLIEVDGAPGDLVTSPPGSFLSRIQGKCLTKKYDWVIVLGGTKWVYLLVYFIHCIFTHTDFFAQVTLDMATNLTRYMLPFKGAGMLLLLQAAKYLP
jgi:hypothetical protein